MLQTTTGLPESVRPADASGLKNPKAKMNGLASCGSVISGYKNVGFLQWRPNPRFHKYEDII